MSTRSKLSKFLGNNSFVQEQPSTPFESSASSLGTPPDSLMGTSTASSRPSRSGSHSNGMYSPRSGSSSYSVSSMGSGSHSSGKSPRRRPPSPKSMYHAGFGFEGPPRKPAKPLVIPPKRSASARAAPSPSPASIRSPSTDFGRLTEGLRAATQSPKPSLNFKIKVPKRKARSEDSTAFSPLPPPGRPTPIASPLPVLSTITQEPGTPPPPPQQPQPRVREIRQAASASDLRNHARSTSAEMLSKMRSKTPELLQQNANADEERRRKLEKLTMAVEENVTSDAYFPGASHAQRSKTPELQQSNASVDSERRGKMEKLSKTPGGNVTPDVYFPGASHRDDKAPSDSTVKSPPSHTHAYSHDTASLSDAPWLQPSRRKRASRSIDLGCPSPRQYGHILENPSLFITSSPTPSPTSIGPQPAPRPRQPASSVSAANRRHAISSYDIPTVNEPPIASSTATVTVSPPTIEEAPLSPGAVSLASTNSELVIVSPRRSSSFKPSSSFDLMVPDHVSFEPVNRKATGIGGVIVGPSTSSGLIGSSGNTEGTIRRRPLPTPPSSQPSSAIERDSPSSDIPDTPYSNLSTLPAPMTWPRRPAAKSKRPTTAPQEAASEMWTPPEVGTSIVAQVKGVETLAPPDVYDTHRKEARQGWSGEWNAGNLNDVIKGLRKLK